MPLFEYVCSDCQRHFEAYVTSERQAACPVCQGRNLEKQLSVFAVATPSRSTPSMSSAGCGTCGDPRGPGACSMN